MRFGIFIYDGVEPIDLATFGVLSMARRIAPEISICTIAPRAGAVALANGLKVTRRFRYRRCARLRSRHRHRRPRLERTGAGARDARLYPPRSCLIPHRLRLHRRHDPGGERCSRWWTRDHQKRSGAAGNLTGRGDARTYPRIDVQEAMLVDTRDGIVTGGGVSLCIDTTLHLIAGMLGEHVADETARIMEYQPRLARQPRGFCAGADNDMGAAGKSAAWLPDFERAPSQSFHPGPRIWFRRLRRSAHNGH